MNVLLRLLERLGGILLCSYLYAGGYTAALL